MADDLLINLASVYQIPPSDPKLCPRIVWRTLYTELVKNLDALKHKKNKKKILLQLFSAFIVSYNTYVSSSVRQNTTAAPAETLLDPDSTQYETIYNFPGFVWDHDETVPANRRRFSELFKEHGPGFLSTADSASALQRSFLHLVAKNNSAPVTQDRLHQLFNHFRSVYFT
ncbi:hypothetical protein [Bufonid herpesvirus 1]|uniref:hypothetical protein n=1 Tax=Bufonid herpesvirus 1 TaxID=2282206 RepID=UPI000EB6ADBC|nr:hypothetical protein [Bufonid herpesvirus 1]AXF48632.1 hypothetical protein [Bufonid herpesvirus 1]